MENQTLTEQFMMKSCEVAGVKIDCGKLFQRVPTDSGMCCALNSKKALRDSEYSKMVEEMQEMDLDDNSPANKSKVDAKVG